MASMASSGAAAPKRIERIVASRKNAHGRTTRNTNKGATSLSQGEGASIGGPNNPPNTQPTSVVLELIEADKQSPNHPSQIGKALKQKGFSSFTEIEKLGKFRFRINTTDETRLRKLKLDGDNLRVYEPKNKDHTILFVRGVPLNFEEDEIIENIEVDCPVLQVQRIKRKGSNRDLVDTYNVKITVEGNQIPNSVKIYGCGFKAELYIFPIRQCQNCWRYGHGAKHCTSRTRCASCGGTHDQSVCEKDARCPNCKKPHKANDPTCPEMQRHKKIRLAMREKQIPFSQAESCFPRLTNRFDLLSEEMAGGSDSFPELPGSSQPASSYSPRRRRSCTPRHQDEPNRTTENALQPTSQTKEPSNACRRCQENPFKATDFERLISWLRKEFLTEIRGKRWLADLKSLHMKIAQRIRTTQSELDRDQLLIEIGQDIQKIIADNELQEESRSNQNQHSGV
ncbi:uncharacterized protein LOC115255032 [Aedes albopictus]|uniref:Nucleic-acid-binding protein from transposon X-element n=1 Tax=Aedes albopictus TaxID=7160 RepID=A0ABM1Z8C0_AEDAL|nr:uncharacterized protein LOC115255032 [Aedes albopictus]